jgi:hypothetical protein
MPDKATVFRWLSAEHDATSAVGGRWRRIGG